MKQQDVDEVLACLGHERRVYRYYKDRYCFDLIEWHLQRLGTGPTRIADLKRCKVGRYLNKPLVAKALGHCGSGMMNQGDLGLLSPTEQMPFTISLDRWGDGDRGWDQTSRNQSNLVLQLNFDSGHQALYKRLIRPTQQQGPFESWGHPVVRGDRKTLAWVRMDIDFNTSEVLIEEIQNDWLRKAARFLERVRWRKTRKPSIKPQDVCPVIEASFEDLVVYVEAGLQAYRKLWAEAAMLAALRFVMDELGMSTVFYHSFATGKKLKDVCGAPPKSMYTKLPQDFGFELTTEVPVMLQQNKYSRRYLKAIANPTWYRLDL